jgi:hypothetical protein
MGCCNLFFFRICEIHNILITDVGFFLDDFLKNKKIFIFLLKISKLKSEQYIKQFSCQYLSGVAIGFWRFGEYKNPRKWIGFQDFGPEWRCDYGKYPPIGTKGHE